MRKKHIMCIGLLTLSLAICGVVSTLRAGYDCVGQGFSVEAHSRRVFCMFRPGDPPPTPPEDLNDLCMSVAECNSDVYTPSSGLGCCPPGTGGCQITPTIASYEQCEPPYFFYTPATCEYEYVDPENPEHGGVCIAAVEGRCYCSHPGPREYICEEI